MGFYISSKVKYVRIKKMLTLESCVMLGKNNTWRNRELREHVAVLDGKLKPTIILKNGTYLNIFTKQWLKAHIWIYKDRIVYIGDQLPDDDSGVEIEDCSGKFLVPGYIEPHAHPFQLYNPVELAHHAAKTGTTTLVNDTVMWFFLMNRKKAFTTLSKINELPMSMY